MLKLVIFDFFATLFDAQTQLLYPEAIPLIEWVKGKGLKTALFTNSTGWGMFFTEREKNLFDDTLLADIKGPHELDVILKHLEVKPKETVVVGDSLNREIAAGKTLGTRTIWLGGTRSDDPLHPIASDLTAARSILEQWLKIKP